MASPEDQVLSPQSPKILWTQDQSKCFEAPTNVSTSCILGLGTAVPNRCYSLEKFGMEFLKSFGYHKMPLAKVSIERICKASGIVQKYLAFSPEIYQKHPIMTVNNSPNLGERFDIYEPEAMSIGKLAAERALRDWGQPRGHHPLDLLLHHHALVSIPGPSSCQVPEPPGQCETLQCVSAGVLWWCEWDPDSCGNCPSRPNKQDFGCLCGDQFVAAQSLNPENPFLDMRPSLSNMTYGDGAGAVVIGKHPSTEENTIFQVHGAQTYLIPDTASALAAKLLPSGLQMTVEKKYPTPIGQNIGSFVNELLYDTHLTYDNVNWAVSPGGKAVLNAIEENCKLKDKQLQVSRYILRNYGNMGAATILFVLDKFRNDKKVDQIIHPWTTAVAFGPGVTMEGLLLQFGS